LNKLKTIAIIKTTLAITMKIPTFTPALKIPVMTSQDVKAVRSKKVKESKTRDILFILSDFIFLLSGSSIDFSLTNETILEAPRFFF
jgi:hypothetical protein